MPNWDEYETVFIGYPIWWGVSAWPVDSFVKQIDFGNKAIIPFCTSHSSGLGTSDTDLKAKATGGNWQPGHRLSQDAADAHHKSPMMEEIAALREKYHLHMRVEKYMEIN